jgi:predicted DNA-binding transcriptional regulator AlpA
MKMTEREEYIDTNEAAKLVGVCAGTLKKWRAEGTGPQAVKLGKRLVRYPLSKIHEYLASLRST